MALPTASDNIWPKVILVEGAAPASPAATNFKLYVDSSDHLLKYKNSAGTVVTLGAGMTNPLTTTGDLIYSSSGSTAARLGIGAATTVLHGGASVPAYSAVVEGDLSTSDITTANATTSKHGFVPKLPNDATKYYDGTGAYTVPAGSGGLAVGTSFPGSPSTSALFFRTDRNLLYVYDGTRWLTTTLYHEPFVVDPSSARPNTTNGAGLGSMTMFHSTYDVWLEAFYGTTYVTTNTGSAYWTLTLEKRNVSDSATTIVSYTTAADTQANDVTHSTAIGALMDTTTYKKLDVAASKTGSPGSIYWEFAVSYRLVG